MAGRARFKDALIPSATRSIAMRTVVLSQPEKLEIREGPAAEPAPDEAMVRLRCGGICGTDVQAFLGKQVLVTYPRILGHELAVEILEVPDNGQGLRKGDICAAEPYFECGQCRPCQLGRMNCCENLRLFGIHIDGGFREVYPFPLRKLHPSKLKPEVLAMVEPLTVGLHAVNRMAPQAGEAILLVGAGPIGLAVLASLPTDRVEVAVMDLSPERLDLCRSKGARHLLPADGDVASTIQKAFGRMPDVVVDATGNLASMIRTFDLAASAGRIVFVGLVPYEIRFSDPLLHRKELSIVASRNGTTAEFRDVLQKLEDGRLNIDGWLGRRCSLDELPARLPEWLLAQTGPVKSSVYV
jgi:threonine dehydrogenase-like Zn-dependent dehydrogenase